MTMLSLIFGGIVGLSLGLTGGGGASFAVPLLVYGLQVPAKQAVGISLISVGATSLIGFLCRWKQGEVEIRTGLLFAAAGMVGAPAGAWLGRQIPDTVLLLAFAVLMVVVAARLWQQASQPNDLTQECPPSAKQDAPTCRRDATGTLILNSRCARLLLFVGVLTGCLSGLFGVGGGFVIVPALVLFSGMSMHRAVGTSLLVIALVSVSGVAAQLQSGQQIQPIITLIFVAGGVLGFFIGQRVSRRISGPILQKSFVVAMLAVALLVMIRNLGY